MKLLSPEPLRLAKAFQDLSTVFDAELCHRWPPRQCQLSVREQISATIGLSGPANLLIGTVGAGVKRSTVIYGL